MARAATTSDVFNAIAEPRRRAILELLAVEDQLDVGEMVLRLELRQPAVSKHLNVLRSVGLVKCHKDGKRRLYRLNPNELQPVHAWIQNFERLWADHLDSIQRVAEQKARELAAKKQSP